MSKLMLIDAAHAEETRIIVANNGIIEEFDYQNTYKKLIKGNIYLAKVIRVEPSLQAAFVDYGAEKHGFLPFSEIHPSYYQIPAADKEALISSMMESEVDKSLLSESRPIEQFEIDEDDTEEELVKPGKKKAVSSEPDSLDLGLEDDEGESDLLSEKEQEESSDDQFRPEFHKNYKIQEVIKKDQVLLIQAVKEERGNKGASMTTYISLAGRYCVLMPNSFKAGGVSRKIMDMHERQRLKGAAEELNEKAGKAASVIIRTAGAFKTKTEVKRDFNYLIRLWNNIREHTLASSAPTFIHEEGDVIKKAIRDIYTSDIEQVVVAGDNAFENAKKFLELILPRHVEKVKKFKSKTPLFVKYNIENQLNALYDPVVPLRSGGYIVINQTEALVAIDVNSGRATSERNVENTAIKTNLEAAYEIARQMKLRDLSGLIVIDFIDMEDGKNRRAVERVFRDVLSNDRAKIQVSRISIFGLLEMTRQRLRQSFFESSTNICQSCDGRGRIRPVEATAVAVLRALDNEVAEGNFDQIKVSGGEKLMFYILNNKREEISQLEKTAKAKIVFYIDEEAGADGFFIEKIKKERGEVQSQAALSAIDAEPYTIDEATIPEESEPEPSKDEEPAFDKEPTFDKRQWRKGGGRQQQRRGRDKFSQDSRKRDRGGDHERDRDKVRGVEQEGISEERNAGRRDNKRKGRYQNRFQEKDQVDLSQPKEYYDFEEENKFEESMEKRRKQNQSFLKEIWKKIVE